MIADGLNKSRIETIKVSFEQQSDPHFSLEQAYLLGNSKISHQNPLAVNFCKINQKNYTPDR